MQKCYGGRCGAAVLNDRGVCAARNYAPRSRQALTRQIDQFVIAEIDGLFVGCGSLFRLGNDLVEVRSIGLRDEGKGKGVGSMILEKLTEEAKRQGIPKIMALTYAVDFFLKTDSPW